jgi:hypothetical protein
LRALALMMLALMMLAVGLLLWSPTSRLLPRAGLLLLPAARRFACGSLVPPVFRFLI